MIAKRHWKTGNKAAIVLSIVASLLLLAYSHYSTTVSQQLELQRREAILPDKWFVVRNVAVPDFVQGVDPLITYSREVRQSFIGEWLVEVHRVGEDQFQACYGSGRSRYETDERIPDAGVPLSWFVGNHCDLAPGKYILDTTWRILADGYPPKEVRFMSNPFTVIPEGSQLFLTPEQVKRLDE